MSLGARSCVLVVVLAIGACGRGTEPVEPALRCLDRDHVSIAGDDDVAALAGCIQLPTVFIRTAAPLDLARLTKLIMIEGDLFIGPTIGVTTITLPALEGVTGRVRVSANGDLTGLFLPALRDVSQFEVFGNPSLASISAPALARVGELLLEQLPALELIDTSRLERADWISVAQVPALRTWLVPPLHVETGVRIDAPALDADTRAAIEAAARSR